MPSASEEGGSRKSSGGTAGEAVRPRAASRAPAAAGKWMAASGPVAVPDGTAETTPVECSSGTSTLPALSEVNPAEPSWPDKIVVSSDATWIYVVDTWQRKHKYFDGRLQFQFSWDSAKLGAFVPEVIEGDVAYGTSYVSADQVAFCIVDLGKRTVLAKRSTGISYDNLKSSPSLSMQRTGDSIDLTLYLRTSEVLVVRYNSATKSFEPDQRYAISERDYSLRTTGMLSWRDEKLAASDYAERSKLVTADTRRYYGTYKGYRIWLSTMSPSHADGSSQNLFRLFGATDPETLFVLIGQADDHGTPLKGFYLPAMKYYQYFDPLLAFNSLGQAYLMYVDDGAKRAHVITFDLNELIASSSARGTSPR